MKHWFYTIISGRTIQSKLTLIFAVFIILFNIVTISIYFSSTQMMKQYHENTESLLRLNSISKTATNLSEATKSYVLNREDTALQEYYQQRMLLKEEIQPLLSESAPIEYKNYINLIESLIYQSELTIGFVIRDDIEQYTTHMKEVQSMANYTQETALELLDTSLTEYQPFYVDMQDRSQSFKYFTIFLLISSIMIGIYLAFRLAKGIHHPVRELSRVAGEVSQGNFEGTPVGIESTDELKLLGDSFNTMRSNIQKLIKEIQDQSEQQMLMKELELKHLQNQIQPHFLFNTLNTVTKMAYLEDAHSTSRLIESLASMMRHSLGDLKKTVQLKDEIKMVEEYIHIQRMRFMERIEFHIDSLEDHLNVQIPRLILQPLVENAFIHGLETLEEGGKIELFIHDLGEYALIEVCDNGVGISQNQQSKILNMEEDAHVGHITGIGLVNVIKRLQLFYQEENILFIDSKLGEGTKIKLYLPLQKKGEVA
ncbi:sensor histidine kinase [Gracilibacillus saliphilus]|uniref:sensor histidine kinase n=1 Tax=Gracilibacillus saliphilus TaxID=543890 RepID=UPI0013D02033|nr:sensor histidine kinase [Gracilibacillus saliphilus]